MCSQPLARCRGGSAQDASPPEPGDTHHLLSPLEERYHDDRVRLPADNDAKLVFLRGVIDEGTTRGWKLLSATREPGGDVLSLVWDTSGSFPR